MSSWPSFSAGSAHLFVRPKLASDFKQKLETEVKKVDVEHKVTFSPTLTKTFKADLKALAEGAAGTHKVHFTPTLAKGFKAELKTLVDAAKGDHKVEFGVKLASGFKVELKTLVDSTKGAHHVELSPKLAAGFKSTLKGLVDSAKGTHKVEFEPKLATGFKSTLKGLIDAAKGTHKVDLEVNLVGVTSLQAKLAALGGSHSANVNVDVDLAVAEAKMLAFRAWAGADLNINVDIDSAAAMAQLSALMVQAISLQAILAGMNIPAGGMKAAGGAMGGLASAAGPAVMAVAALAAVSLVPLIGQLLQAAGIISLLPAMGAAAAASLAAVVIGGSGVKDAFDAAKKSTEESGKAAEDSAKRQRDAAEQVADAERSVADAREDAAWTAKDGARQIESAEKSVAQALKRTEDAQEDLTRARKDAKEEIQDLNLALKGSAISEEDALIAVERARERLRNLGKDGSPVTALDVREAQNNLRGAFQRVDEVRERNKDLRDETLAANKAGVEGSDQVIAAKEQVAEAVQGEKDAEEDLARTHEEVARSNAQSQRRIEDALRNVAKAQSAQAEAMTASATAADKFADAMAKLSPNAQDFVNKLRDMGGAWTEVRKQVQDSLFSGLGASMQELGDSYFPKLRIGLGGIATEINGGLKRAIEDLNTESVKLDWSTILENTRLAIGPFMDGISSLVGAMTNIASVGSSFLPGGAESFAETMERFEAWTESPEGQQKIRDFMSDSIASLIALKDLFIEVGRIVGGLFSTSEENGKSMIQSMTDNLKDFADWMGTPEGQARLAQFWDDAQQTASDLLRLVGEAIKLADKVAKIVDSKFGLTTGNQGLVDENGTSVDKDGNRVIGRTGIFPGIKADSWLGRLFGGGDDGGTSGEDGGVPGGTSFDPNGLESELQNRLQTGEGVEGQSFLGDLGDPEKWGEKWTSFSDTVSDGWNNNVYPSLKGVKDKAVEIGSAFVDDVKVKAGDAWEDLRGGVSSGWSSIQGTWQTLRTEGLGGLADDFSEKITGGAVTSWQDLPSHVASGARDMIDTHFPALGAGLNTLEGTFNTVVGAIAGIWDGLRDKLATPINWVIENVFNNGIVAFWNGIANKIGLQDIKPIPLINGGGSTGGIAPKVKAFSTGGTVDGVMSGYSPGRDDRIIAVGGGEAVMRPEWTRAVGKDFVDNANQIARTKGVGGVKKFMGGFSNGGVVESIIKLAQENFPGLSVTSTVRNTNDLHGQGKAVDLSNQSAGGPSTPLMQDAARFFHSNYGSKLAELIHWPLNGWQNIDEGKPFNFQEPTNSQHTDHVHVAAHSPLVAMSDEEKSLFAKIAGAVGGAVKSVSNVFRNMAANVFEIPLNGLGSTIPDQFPGVGEFGRVPKALFNTVKDRLIDTVRGKAAEKDNASGSSAELGEFGGSSMEYAQTIVDEARARGLGPEGAKVALMTALAESNLRMWANTADPESLNYPHDAVGSDHDSVGLFQQRANGAWGTTEQRMNPKASASMFYDALTRVNGWQDMPPHMAAQSVQRSAYADGSNYAAYSAQADQLVAQLYDAGGVLEPDSMSVNLSGKPEAVFTNDEWMLFEDLARLLNQQDFVEQLRTSLEGPKEPAANAGQGDNGLSGDRFSAYGTGEGTAAEMGYTLPTGELSKDLKEFDKLHGMEKPGTAAGKTVFPAFGSPEHIAQAGAIFQNATSTFAGAAQNAGTQFLSGWIPEEFMNPQGMVGGLISAGKELSGWFNENHGTPDILNDPLGSLGQVATGFAGGEVPPPLPNVDAGAVNQQVDSMRKNAPAAGNTAATGDSYHFHVSNVDEAFRKWQVEQAKKAATFIRR